jgi:TolB protein
MQLIVLFFIILSPLFSYAIETITIDRGVYEPTPIAINDFATSEAGEVKLASSIVKVITADLKHCGLFHPISNSAFIETTLGIDHKPLFASWRQINANLLLNGSISKLENGKVKIQFILWDSILEKDMAASEFVASEESYRRIAHKIADKIYEIITGDKGYFDTRIAYITSSGPYLKRVRRMAIMDYDGANHKYLTDGKNLVLTPRLSPHADKILYLSYEGRRPNIHLRDLKTGKDSVIGHFPGMSFAPRFSPTGNKALFSISKNGATNIYELDLNSKALLQLTRDNSINTSPTYSPDGSKIVFNSDRTGSRQLYVMNSNGGNVERLSFGSGWYATPVWSPRGDYIAFTKMTKGLGFTIGIMPAVASENNEISEQILASGYLVESPSWAPNGRMLVYTKESLENTKKGKTTNSKIYSVDITGHKETQIPTPGNASDPEWSQRLD